MSGRFALEIHPAERGSRIAGSDAGFLGATRRILEGAKRIKEGTAAVPGIKVLGAPLRVIAFASDEFDIYRTRDCMTKKHWNLNGLHRPACFHICVRLRLTQEGVAKRFVEDLTKAVDWVRYNPEEKGGDAAAKGVISDVLKKYLDLLYRVS